MMEELTDLVRLLIDVDDELLRELINGMWFILSLEIFLALLFYLVHRVTRKPSEPGWLWVTPDCWYRELGTKLAFALAVFTSGSVVRAGWIWMLLECQNRVGRGNCEHIANTSEWLYLASFLAITGGVCTIRVMLLEKWRPWSWFVPAIIAVVVPVAVHVLR